MSIILVEDILRPRLGLYAVGNGSGGWLRSGRRTALLAASPAPHSECGAGGSEIRQSTESIHSEFMRGGEKYVISQLYSVKLFHALGMDATPTADK